MPIGDDKRKKEQKEEQQGERTSLGIRKPDSSLIFVSNPVSSLRMRGMVM